MDNVRFNHRVSNVSNKYGSLVRILINTKVNNVGISLESHLLDRSLFLSMCRITKNDE